MRQKSRALSNLILVKRRTFYAFNTWIKFGTCEMRCLHRELPGLTVTSNSLRFLSVQYVAQYPDGTSIRTLKTKTQFLRRPFQLSVNEVFRMKAEHFSFKMKVLASWKLAKQSQKTPFCSSLSIKAFLRVRGEEILDGSLFSLPSFPFSPRNTWYSGYSVQVNKHFMAREDKGDREDILHTHPIP